MPTAEIITIGTELTLGEIVDTNTPAIARALRHVGVDVYRTQTVGDNQDRIAQAINESLSRADIVITSGGLGPTVDDPTRQAAAEAYRVDLAFSQSLWTHIKDQLKRFDREVTENNRRQATIPRGGLAFKNIRGTAPAFLVEDERGVLIALPGVPPEMEYLLEHEVIPWLQAHFSLEEVILTSSFHVSGIGESKVDDLIGAFERYRNPTVGLSAHKGSVEVRITAKAKDKERAREEIRKVERQLRARLSRWILPEKTEEEG